MEVNVKCWQPSKFNQQKLSQFQPTLKYDLFSGLGFQQKKIISMGKECLSEKSPIIDSQKSKKTTMKLLIMSPFYRLPKLTMLETCQILAACCLSLKPSHTAQCAEKLGKKKVYFCCRVAASCLINVPAWPPVPAAMHCTRPGLFKLEPRARSDYYVIKSAAPSCSLPLPSPHYRNLSGTLILTVKAPQF